MGRAYILVNADVVTRLRTEKHFLDQIRIIEANDHGDGLIQALVASPLLPDNTTKQQCLVLEPLGFSPDLDT